MEFLPRGGIVHEYVFCQHLQRGSFYDGDGEGHDAVGGHDVAAVAVTLFAITFILFYEYFRTAFDLREVLYRGKICRVD